MNLVCYKHTGQTSSLTACRLRWPLLHRLFHLELGRHIPEQYSSVCWTLNFYEWNCAMSSVQCSPCQEHPLLQSQSCFLASNWWPQCWLECWRMQFLGGTHHTSLCHCVSAFLLSLLPARQRNTKILDCKAAPKNRVLLDGVSPWKATNHGHN